MNEERAKRKLSGILSADAVGYSRLMQEDEAATVATLKEYREIMASLIQKFNGRVVDSPGDNILAEFGSVVDAVECAVEVQKELKKKNERLPDDRKMVFRIGVHLGDVIEDEERIYGDGVNIAARIEGLAESGGICISRTTYDQIKNKLNLGYEYLGDHTVKNIAEPVRVYRVLTEPEAAGKVIGEKRFLGRFSRRTAVAAIIILVIVVGGLIGWNIYLQQSKKVEPASLDKMTYPLPDKPSIAVLPFDNLSGDPGQEYFSDGLTEEIISGLSKVPSLFVIARNSSFTYKGKPVKVQQVSEELGVRYVLEGSVRKDENRVRITAQLIDALKGHHIWSERYDRDLKDAFAMQDEITLKIIRAMQIKLTDGEQVRLYGKKTDNLDAYLMVLEGREYFYRTNEEDNILARQILEEAITLDPNYALAYRFLAGTYHMEVWFGLSKSPKESLGKAIQLAKKAIALDDSLAEAYGLLGWLYLLIRQHDKAIAQGKHAVDLAPNSAENLAWFGVILSMADQPEKAIPLLEKAIRLDPIPPNWYLWSLGFAYRETGRYEDAITVAKKASHREPNDLIARIVLTLAYIELGREDEAHAEALEVLRINPKFSVGRWAKVRPHIDPANTARAAEKLRKAGLK